MADPIKVRPKDGDGNILHPETDEEMFSFLQTLIPDMLQTLCPNAKIQITNDGEEVSL